MDSSRLAVIAASFWRSEPAAELRGLMNNRSPASAWRALSASNAGRGMYTSPRTSSTDGAPFGRRSGTASIVAMLAVTSSPIRPSPRVAPCTNRPFS